MAFDWNWVFGSYSLIAPAATAFASPDLLVTQICRHVDHKIAEIKGFSILRTDIGTGWILKDNYHEDTAYVYHNAFQISVMVAPLFQQAGFANFYFVCLFVCLLFDDLFIKVVLTCLMCPNCPKVIDVPSTSEHK